MVKPQGFQKLTPTDEALKTWFTALQLNKPKHESVMLKDALRRVLAKDLVACEPLPRFDKSAMDGYAVKAADIAGASQAKPALLKLTHADHVGVKEAKQIWTGNPIPSGADTVIMLEDTQQHDGEIEAWSQLELGRNVSKVGEDIQKGTLIASAGSRLTPYHLGLAAAQGYTHLEVAQKPKIAIIATGNEIVEVGSQRLPNQIYDANKTMIAAMCHELGAETIDFGIVEDNTEKIAKKIQIALARSDAVITTGGTSVGGMDFVPDAVNSLGKPGVIVHGVALRPAMPTAVGMLEEKPVLVLSGNPVAAVIGFEVFGRPLICRMLGMPQEEPRHITNAVLSRKIAGVPERKTYVRVCVALMDGKVLAVPVSAKGSGSISTMTQSNGYVIIDGDCEGYAEGETVTVHMFANMEVE